MVTSHCSRERPLTTVVALATGLPSALQLQQLQVKRLRMLRQLFAFSASFLWMLWSLQSGQSWQLEHQQMTQEAAWLHHAGLEQCDADPAAFHLSSHLCRGKPIYKLCVRYKLDVSNKCSADALRMSDASALTYMQSSWSMSAFLNLCNTHLLTKLGGCQAECQAFVQSRCNALRHAAYAGPIMTPHTVQHYRQIADVQPTWDFSLGACSWRSRSCTWHCYHPSGLSAAHFGLSFLSWRQCDAPAWTEGHLASPYHAGPSIPSPRHLLLCSFLPKGNKDEDTAWALYTSLRYTQQLVCCWCHDDANTNVMCYRSGAQEPCISSSFQHHHHTNATAQVQKLVIQRAYQGSCSKHWLVEQRRTFCLPPETTLYCAFLGSVWTSMRCWQHGAVIVKDHIFVLWYLPISCFSALNRTPLPIRCPHPSHHTLNGISNLQVQPTILLIKQGNFKYVQPSRYATALHLKHLWSTW